MLALAECAVDLETGAIVGGHGGSLTDRERVLLAYLAARPSEVVSRAALLTEVWGYASEVQTRAIDNTVARLRTKIEPNPQQPRHVLTVHGDGYRFVPLRSDAPEPAPAPLPHRRLVLGDRTVDPDALVVRGPSGTVAISAAEAALLTLLAERGGRPVERAVLARALGVGRGRSIQNHVYRLRTKIEVNPLEPRHLLTAGRGGYRLELGLPPAERSRRVLVHVAMIEASLEQSAPRAAELARTLARAAIGGVPVGDGWKFAFDEGRPALKFALAIPAEAERAGLCVRVGVHRGSVVMTPDPSTGRLAVHGDDVDRADSLARLAPPGQVWVDAALWTDEGTTANAAPVGHGAVAIGEARAALPWFGNRFFGRRAERDQIARSLGERRLVTLVGPPGVGKSRLMVEVLRVSSPAAWVSLGPLDTEEDVLGAVAAALDVELVGEEPAEQLRAAMAARPPFVLALDDVDVGRSVARRLLEDWLVETRVRVVATSRRALELPGEHVVTVEPLPLDDATALFYDRAATTAAVADADLVRTLVEQLEGIPLAVELGAARTATLPVAGILARMPDRLRLLAGDAGRSLTAALDVSWGLLDRHEATTLACCSVFRGGFAPDAVEAVLGGADTDPWSIDLVGQLVRHNLVRMDGDRYLMLDAVRAYAARRLAEDPAAERRAEQAHGRWYARLGARDAVAELAPALAREAPNLDRALATAVARGDAETAADVGVALARFRRFRGPVASGIAAADRALSLPGPRQAELRTWRAALLATGGEYDRGDAEFERAVALAAGTGDAEIEALALTMWARALHQRHPTAVSRGRHERALALIGTPTTPTARHAWLLARYGAARTAPPDERIDALEAVLLAARDLGDVQVEASTLGELANCERNRGRLARAREHCEAALAHYQTQGNRWGEALARATLAGTLRYDDPATAIAQFDASRELLRRNGQRAAEVVAVGNRGAVAYDTGDLEGARRTFAEARDLAILAGVTNPAVVFGMNLGQVLFELGRGAEAREELVRAMALARSLGDSDLIANAAMAATSTTLWPVAEGLALVEAAAARQPSAGLRAGLEIRRARLLSDAGRVEEARDALASAEAGLPGGAGIEPRRRDELERLRARLSQG